METKEKIKAAEHDWWILPVITNYSSVRGRIQVKVAHDSQWSFNFIFFFYTSFNIFIFMEILRNTEYVYWKKIPYLSFSLFFSQGNYKRFIKCFKNSKYCNFFSLVKIKVFFFNKSRFSIIKALLIAHLVVWFTRRVKCISRSDNKVSWLTLEALQQIRTRCYRMIRAILLIKNKSKISILSKRDQALF